uniref:polyprenyl synthetase family protein n=1 Tax=Helicobacter sp. 15-1451 TaxID=2004995 RepID=UPI00215B7D4A|nr:polyprenyl synthetase family protein [Helicobacter sp. 15-1451]
MIKLDTLLLEFEDFLQNHQLNASSYHPHYEVALWQMVKNGGKRFRPRLFLGVLLALNPSLLEQQEQRLDMFYPALAIEVLHTYSLIHDDLPAMDNASLRRCNPTLHVCYDDALAILAGDGLNTYAFYLLSQSPLPDSVKIALIAELSYNGGVHGMVLGQALDCHFESQPLTLAELQFLHQKKTGALIAASLKMGAIVACENANFCENLYQIGLKLGLFFQIHDDMIDALQTSEEAGKTTHNDVSKNSYVNLLGLEESQNHLEQIKQQILDMLQEFSQQKYAPLKTFFDDIFLTYF